MFKLLLPAFLFLVVASCEFKAEVKMPEHKQSNSKIKNGIEIKSKGLAIGQAFLMYEDGTLIPESNEVKVAQKIYLRLIIDSGWTAQNGKVYPGAEEKIETSDGKLVLDEKDLFVTAQEGVTTKDAGVLTLSAVISSIDKLYDYFLVSIRLWDKKSSAYATASYKFYIK